MGGGLAGHGRGRKGCRKATCRKHFWGGASWAGIWTQQRSAWPGCRLRGTKTTTKAQNVLVAAAAKNDDDDALDAAPAGGKEKKRKNGGKDADGKDKDAKKQKKEKKEKRIPRHRVSVCLLTSYAFCCLRVQHFYIGVCDKHLASAASREWSQAI